MPALPHHTFDMSRTKRLSSNTSVLVTAVPTFHGVKPVPAAARFAVETPVPFGKVTPVKPFQVIGHGRNDSGSDRANSRRGAQWNSRSPLNCRPAGPLQAKVPTLPC